MIPVDSDAHLKLSVQRALLGNVTTSLRSVSADLDGDGKQIYLRFIFERVPDPSDRDAVFECGAEVIADYPEDWTLKEEIIVCPPPKRMKQRQAVVFLRQDHD
jgi:hypothetical protein